MPTVLLVTVTVQVAVLLPSTVVTVIVAVPSAMAVTTPDAETVATAVLLLDHVTALFVAVLGATTAISVPVLPSSIESVVASSDTPVTDTVGGGGGGAAVTVTVAVAGKLPSAVVTVMVAVPAATAVTTPVGETVATAPLDVAHVTDWFVAVMGKTLAVSVPVVPATSDSEPGVSVTPVTGIVAAVTVTVAVAGKLPSLVVTVMIAVPAATADTTPVAETVATAGSDVDHVTALFEAVAGKTVSVSVPVVPATSDSEVGAIDTLATGV